MGFFCLVLSFLLLFSTLYQSFSFWNSLDNTSHRPSAYTPSFLAGQVVAFLIFITGAFFLAKLGWKWFREKITS